MASPGSLADKARLKRAYRRLRAITLSGPAEASAPALAPLHAQELLDVLAVLAGLKPVYVLGRGFDDAGWAAGLETFASDHALPLLDGPFWQAEMVLEGFPPWYVAASRHELAQMRARYVCRTRAFAEEVRAVNATGAPSLAAEARLLGFPACCVGAHRARERAFHEAWYAIARRRTGDDVAAMTALIAADSALDPETEEEEAAYRFATALAVAPFTSVNMCPACAASSESPAMRLSARYAELADAVDRSAFSILGAASADRS